MGDAGSVRYELVLLPPENIHVFPKSELQATDNFQSNKQLALQESVKEVGA